MRRLKMSEDGRRRIGAPRVAATGRRRLFRRREAVVGFGEGVEGHS